MENGRKFIFIELKQMIDNGLNEKGIPIREPKYDHARLEKNEFPNTFLDHEITESEFSNALDVIITMMQQRDLHTINVDLDIRNKSLEPVDMTMDEICDILGRKVRIVKEKTEKKEEPKQPEPPQYPNEPKPDMSQDIEIDPEMFNNLIQGQFGSNMNNFNPER